MHFDFLLSPQFLPSKTKPFPDTGTLPDWRESGWRIVWLEKCVRKRFGPWLKVTQFPIHFTKLVEKLRVSILGNNLGKKFTMSYQTPEWLDNYITCSLAVWLFRWQSLVKEDPCDKWNSDLSNCFWNAVLTIVIRWAFSRLYETCQINQRLYKSEKSSQLHYMSKAQWKKFWEESSLENNFNFLQSKNAPINQFQSIILSHFAYIRAYERAYLHPSKPFSESHCNFAHLKSHYILHLQRVS